MILFTDFNDIAQLARIHGEKKFFTKLINNIKEDFSKWDSFDKSARTANHSEFGVIELMPIANQEFQAFKYVNGHPVNPFYGLQTVVAFGALSDVKSGYPLLISDLTLATAFRTAATSALAARYLARSDASTMAIIGNGTQAEFQALAFHYLLGINHIRCFDIDPNASTKFYNNLTHIDTLNIEVCTSANDAVRDSDIITTVTADKKNATILTADMIKPGVHINAIGGDCPGKTEIDIDILLHAKIVVEFEAQTRVEGDIQQIPSDYPVLELWEVINKPTLGRCSAQEVTVFDSVGFALEDFSTLRLIYELANCYSIGKKIPLLPLTKDPKNLYGLITQESNKKMVKTNSEGVL
jgi:ornithine cyclodeaminase